MAEHARYLQASSAHRWMTCVGAPAMEDGLPDSSSVHAEYGTAAHELAALCLIENRDALVYKGRVFNGHPVDEDMIEGVQAYLEYVRRTYGQYSAAELLVERRVDFRRYLGLPTTGPDADEDEGFGTADVIILAPSEGNNPDHPSTLHVIDLKFGKGVQVEATENKQMMLYGLGALAEYAIVEDFERVHLHIVQPRIDHYDEYALTKDELLAFAATAEDRAQLALRTVAERKAGKDITDYLEPGESQCRFCKAKATCPALTGEVLGAVFGDKDFDDLTTLGSLSEDDIGITSVEGAQPEVLGLYMSKLGLIEDWMKAIRAEVERLLFEGKPVPGFKLVEGRQGPRKWTDEGVVETLMKKHKLKTEERYQPRKLISPTEAERRFAKKLERTWQHLTPLIIRDDGKPSVAPESDKRPAYQPVKPGDFGEIAGSDLI